MYQDWIGGCMRRRHNSNSLGNGRNNSSGSGSGSQLIIIMERDNVRDSRIIVNLCNVIGSRVPIGEHWCWSRTAHVFLSMHIVIWQRQIMSPTSLYRFWERFFFFVSMLLWFFAVVANVNRFRLRWMLCFWNEVVWFGLTIKLRKTNSVSRHHNKT